MGAKRTLRRTTKNDSEPMQGETQTRKGETPPGETKEPDTVYDRQATGGEKGKK